MKRDFLTLLDYSSDEIAEILSIGATLKEQRKQGVQSTVMQGKTGVLIFDKPSLRTKLTFETGIFELGGNALSMAATTGKLGERESIADMAHNLERWVHLLVVRTFSQESIVELAKYASVPVINALTDEYHPCQSMALGMLVNEKFGGDKITMTYVGDGNNVCVSHMLYAAKSGHNFIAATPKGYEPPAAELKAARDAAKAFGTTISVTNNPEEAVAASQLVYTDVWASMGQESEADARATLFAPYQINDALMSKAPSEALFSHCLPAHRGDEVTDSVIDSTRSVVFDEAENRLHAHKAIMSFLLNESTK